MFNHFSAWSAATERTGASAVARRDSRLLGGEHKMHTRFRLNVPSELACPSVGLSLVVSVAAHSTGSRKRSFERLQGSVQTVQRNRERIRSGRVGRVQKRRHHAAETMDNLRHLGCRLQRHWQQRHKSKDNRPNSSHW